GQVRDPVATSAFGALPARHHGGAGLRHRLRRAREVSEHEVRARRIGGDLAALRVRPARHRVRGPRPPARVQAEAERLLPPPGLRDVPAGPVPGADHPVDRRGQHHLGRGLPAPGLRVAGLARAPEQESGPPARSRPPQDHLRQRRGALQHLRRGSLMSTLEIPSLEGKVSLEEWAARVDLAAAYRLVALFGWEDLVFTHISLRVPGTEDQFLINPYGVFFDEITASSLVKIDLEGNKVEDSPFPVNAAGFIIHSA